VLISAAGVFAGLESSLLFAALVLWLGGGALYLWIVTLIFFRYTFLQMAPEDLTPPDWINMGAVAISALVGSTLIEHTALSQDVAEIAPFVKGCTLVFWAVATWWIPMLLVLGVWRYLIRGVPLAYDPLYWGAYSRWACIPSLHTTWQKSWRRRFCCRSRSCSWSSPSWPGRRPSPGFSRAA
jgi:tellurite resistance protein TehA-like permease